MSSSPSFWNNNSDMQELADKLQALVPCEGAVAFPRKNRALEKFRVAVNCYYDLYNNGLCNRAAQFRRVFGFSAVNYRLRGQRYEFSDRLYTATEEAMREIVSAAAIEQQIVA